MESRDVLGVFGGAVVIVLGILILLNADAVRKFMLSRAERMGFPAALYPRAAFWAWGGGAIILGIAMILIFSSQ